MNRFRIMLPVVSASLVSLGTLMYAGSKGYNCVGPYDSRAVAQPPFDWRWYLAVSLVAVAASFAPLVAVHLKGRQTPTG